MWGDGTIGIRRGVAGGASDHHSSRSYSSSGGCRSKSMIWSLVIGSVCESILVSDFMTPSIIVGMSSWVRGTISLVALCGNSSGLLHFGGAHHGQCLDGWTLNTFGYSNSFLLVSQKATDCNNCLLCVIWPCACTHYIIPSIISIQH